MAEAAAATNEAAAAAIDVLGYAATVCFAFLLAPQIWLNQKRRSTDGLSLLLVLLWHASALLYLPFLLLHRAPTALVVQWVVFSGAWGVSIQA